MMWIEGLTTKLTSKFSYEMNPLFMPLRQSHCYLKSMYDLNINITFSVQLPWWHLFTHYCPIFHRILITILKVHIFAIYKRLWGFDFDIKYTETFSEAIKFSQTEYPFNVTQTQLLKRFDIVGMTCSN